MDELTRARNERIQLLVRLLPNLWTNPLVVCTKLAPVLHRIKRTPNTLALILIGLTAAYGSTKQLQLIGKESAGLGE